MHVNLGIEEYFFRETNDDILLIYINSNSIVVGRNQVIFCEANLDFCKKNKIEVARRISGGGTVFHDKGNLNIALIGKKKLPDLQQVISKILLEFEIATDIQPDNSIWFEGYKISGFARASSQNRELQHSTLLYDSDIDLMNNALESVFLNCDGQLVKSNKSLVNNIKALKNTSIKVNKFFEQFSNSLINELGIIDFDNYEIDKKLLKKHINEMKKTSWIYKSSTFAFFSSKLQRMTKVELEEDIIKSVYYSDDENRIVETSFVGLSVYELI